MTLSAFVAKRSDENARTCMVLIWGASLTRRYPREGEKTKDDGLCAVGWFEYTSEEKEPTVPNATPSMQILRPGSEQRAQGR